MRSLEIYIFVVEGRKASHHFVEQDAESPPVDDLGVTVTKEELWCEVLGCTTEGCQREREKSSVHSSQLTLSQNLLTVGGLTLRHVELAETKVTEGNVASVVEENVFGFEVSVDDVEAVQVFEGAEELSGVEAGAVLAEAAFTLEVVEELTAVDKGEAEVELFGVLEAEFERDNERVVDLAEDGALCEGVGDFRARHDVGFPDGLEGAVCSFESAKTSHLQF